VLTTVIAPCVAVLVVLWLAFQWVPSKEIQGKEVEVAKFVLQALATAVGGVWLFRKFISQREDLPHIDLDLKIDWLGTRRDHSCYVAMISATITNNGLASHTVHEAKYRLLFLDQTDPTSLEDVDTHYPETAHSVPSVHRKTQLDFPTNPHPDLGENWTGSARTFVERGTSRTYSVLVPVPTTTEAVLLTSMFTSTDGARLYHQCSSWVPDLSRAQEQNPQSSSLL
jgi:hypothetical protein